MEASMSTQEQQLCEFLMGLAAKCSYRYSEQAERELLSSLFWCMANGNPQYMDRFFPSKGGPLRGGTLKLREAQGAVNGAEYTEAARGHACGHIFRAGEATYACKTCGTDDTCCLCSRCFESTDHRGHMVRISVSPGNSGCCDCGDAEAWRTPMFCTIHSAWQDGSGGRDKGKAPLATPRDLEDSIRMTISRVLDFMCDVISCSPEQLRQTKTVQSIRQDEHMSRLSPTYGGGDTGPPEEYAVLLWNDEKHTVTDVMNQVARACRVTMLEGQMRAHETDEIGRSLLKHSPSIEGLLQVARILEEIKVTVTIRSSRDTFREQMCGSIIEWLGDISGCSVGDDHNILRRVVCEELLRPWRKGSPASHAIVGENGIDDEDTISQNGDDATNPVFAHELDLLRTRRAARAAMAQDSDDDGEDDDDDDEDDIDIIIAEVQEEDDDDDNDEDHPDEDATMDEEGQAAGTSADDADDGDVVMSDAQPGEVMPGHAAHHETAATVAAATAQALNAGGDPNVLGPFAAARSMVFIETARRQTEAERASMTARTAREAEVVVAAAATEAAGLAAGASGAGHTAVATPVSSVPSAAATSARRSIRERDITPSDSDTAEPLIAASTYAKVGIEIPKTPGGRSTEKVMPPKPGTYWLGVPLAYMECEGVQPAEDLFQRVRLDWLILFDLRMWKKVRNDLRSLYISTVVTIPEFKRVLGLRFAGLYTTLAQLYLIGDREPDHSIINISLQMLTTPSITAEIVERGNFLTSLMAILYTFLTTRQVGHPWDVSSNAVLAFDSGSVTNRRMYHFFVDLKYLFSSPHVQERLRVEDRYMMQFLDLVKLHQGICPNTRAIGEHVEYETDTWISASLITREINRLCRQFSEAFRNLREPDYGHLHRAIRFAAKSAIINSIGAERVRFAQAEIREEVRFRQLSDIEFDSPTSSYQVVRFVVDRQPISFHHALHYTLSWLIECGKFMSIETLRALLTFTTQDLKSVPRSMGRKVWPRQDYKAEDYLLAAFDYSLRVCAWLAQMKAGMWVRNGISLRHQAGTYRGVSQRDVAHHRDIFLLQTALVVCNPSRVVASIIDRFGMEFWVKGIFEQKSEGQDDAQHLDVVEDMIHLLIVLVSDRTSLVETGGDDTDAQLLALRRDIIHVLCFRPLSYSDICNKLPDKFQEQENFQKVLEELTTFKAPDGNADVGTFELDPRYIEEVDPYIAHYNKNQREESEAAYRKWMGQKTGQPIESIVYEPRLRPITSGAFMGLSNFMSTGIFAQLVYYSLLYPLTAWELTPSVPMTRVETFLQVLLHLVLIAIAEDKTSEAEEAEGAEEKNSFVRLAINKMARSNFMVNAPMSKTVVALLDMMSTKTELKSCHAKIALILKRMRQKRPQAFEAAYARLGIPVDRISTASPANQNNAAEERERKKQAALQRQARVMAQFQEQQKSFLANQGDIDWGIVDDEDEDEDMDQTEPTETEKKLWKYPAGTCILCQENTDERRLYGTFAFFTESMILRQTDLQDPDFVREAASTPKNLDRSAESLRPFGVAHENRQKVVKVSAEGETFETERQDIGKGFPSRNCQPGTLSVGCGHIMHYHCFEAYFDATLRRHHQQIARHHPEDTDRLEFVCPLCKALGNAFLPIIWKGKEESYPGALVPEESFATFLDDQMTKTAVYAMGAPPRPSDGVLNSFTRYLTTSTIHSIHDKVAYLVTDAWEPLTRTTTGSNSGGGAGTTVNGVNALWPAMPQAIPVQPSGGPGAMLPPGMSGHWGASGSGGGSGSGSGNIMRELVAVYRRLCRTLRKNDLKSHFKLPDATSLEEELCFSDTLVQAVGYSISAVEIQQRGTDAEYGMTLVSKIPDQQLTHLRVLCETVTSYISVGSHRYGGRNQVDSEFWKDSERQHCQLFMAQYLGEETENTRRPADHYAPLLGTDSFVFLCECVFGVVAAQKLPLAHAMRMCYLAEIVRVVYHMGRNIPGSAWINSLMRRTETPQSAGAGAGAEGDAAALENFAQFCLSVVQLDLDARTRPGSSVIDASILAADALGENRGFAQEGLDTLAGYYRFVRRYALVFLRKCVVLMHVHGGVDLQSHVSPAPERDELDRLTESLRLPTFDEMCTALTERGPAHGWPAPTTPRLVGGWIRHTFLHATAVPTVPTVTDKPTRQPNPSALLSHPGIFELVGLPQHFDQLLDECTRCRCPTTGKDLSDPMICLLCGAVFCGQAICCLIEEKGGRRGARQRIGGAQQHMRKCQGNIGLFLSIRKCCIYYLHRMSGSYGYAPYIDKYGEVDLGFRHGRPLLLNQRRYDSLLRAVWLSHGIPSFISRKLEMDINNGGWETI